LGPGVTFDPGVSTIGFAADNDAVRGSDGSAPAGNTVVILEGDGDAPVITELTLDRIDGELNGTGPAGGVLQVPVNNFTIDVSHSDPSGTPIDPAATVVEASVTVTTPAGALAAGTDLTPYLAATSGAGSTSYRVPVNVVFSTGSATVQVFAVDQSGMVSQPSTFAFRLRALDNSLRPFEATQLWFLDTARDVESYVHDLGQPLNPVQMQVNGSGQPIANGQSDLYDLWFILGLLGNNAAVNNTVVSQLRAAIIARLDALMPAVNVSFTFDRPGTFPSGVASVPYGNLPFSQICIAGAEDETGTSGILGVALFDAHNTTQDNDCLLNFAGGQRLGVFMHTIINDGLRPPAGSTFRLTYDPFTPGFTGVPIGEAPDGDDPGRLNGTVTGARATAIDNASLFPPGAINVMTPVLSFGLAIHDATAFNSLNLAYLRERVVYD
jgi:hypothetical protein